MKSKRILFKTSGILKCVVGAMIVLFFGLTLLLLGAIKNMLLDNYEALKEFVETIALDDPEYSFLLDQSPQQVVDYLFGSINILCIVFTIWGLASITLGVFTLLFVNKYNIWLRCRTGRKILFTVLDWIFYIGLIAKVLSTIATFLKDKPIEEIEV